MLVICCWCSAVSLSSAQSNHANLLAEGGTWHLHSRIPLGSDSLRLQPSQKLIALFATAEAPEFEGWTLESPHSHNPALLDVARKAVHALPRKISFRVTASARDRIDDGDPLPIETSTNLEDFLLGLHFRVQIFRGMEKREVEPVSTRLIGVPADEQSDERVYRASFNLGDVRPDDRIVLLVLDAAGNRLSKFHLEFL
jgi:hypothetical protein